MRTLAFLVGLVAFSSGSAIGGTTGLAGVPPETDLTTLKRGFTLELVGPIEIPIGGVHAAVFVYQAGRLHAGMYAWRGGRFIVSPNPFDPSRDVALDASRASCQIHVDEAVSPWSAEQPLRSMMYSGSISEANLSMYSALSPDEKTFFTCLAPAPTANERVPFLAADLMDVFGNDLREIRAR